MIKAVAFDLDHTLFDRYATLTAIGKDIFDWFKINPKYTTEEITSIMITADRNNIHKGWDAVQNYITEKTDLFEQKLKPNDYRLFIMSCFSKVAIPFPFVIPMLESLKEMGLKLALITNGSSELQRKKLELLGLEDNFDYIYVGGEHEKSKPHLEPFFITAENLGYNPQEILFVGDNPINDIDASRRAGYIPVFVNTTKTWIFPDIKKPELQVETVAEIPNIVIKLNS